MRLRRTLRNMLSGAIASSLLGGTACATAPVSQPQSPPPSGKGPSSSDSGELSPWPLTRYEKMIRKSPFAPATVAPVAAVVPGFAANLYLSGLGKIGDRDFVSISSRDQTTKFTLVSGESSADGIQLVSVQWADAIGKSKVTVKKGTEFGVLEYDQALLQKPVQMSAQGGAPTAPSHIAGRPIVVPRTVGQPNQNFQSQQNPFQGGNPSAGLNPNQTNSLHPNVSIPNPPQPVIPIRRRSVIRNAP